MHRGPVRASATASVLGALVLAALVSPAPAQAACSPSRTFVSTVSLAPSGTSAEVGTAHTITATVSAPGPNGGPTPAAGVCVSFEQSSGPSAGWPRTAVTDSSGAASVTYTSSSTGTDLLYAQATGPQQTITSNQVRHTWTAPPPPPPPPPPPSPTPSPTPPPPPPPPPSPTPTATSPTYPPPTTSPKPSPTRPATGPTPPAATPTATAPGSTPTPASPSGSPPASTPPPAAPSPHLGSSPPPAPGQPAATLDRPSALPGGTVGLTGQGCPAGSPVRLTLKGTSVGTATADGSGTFRTAVSLPDLPIGAYAVDVACGGVRASAPIDLVVATSGPIAGSLAATASAVLLFFVLLAGLLLYRDQGVRRRPEEEGDDLDVT